MDVLNLNERYLELKRREMGIGWHKIRIAEPKRKSYLWVILSFVFISIFIIGVLLAHADTTLPVDQIADAIYVAEGGVKTTHPYGILAHYKHTTPRQACINTINSALKRFAKQKKEKDFIHFLSLTYCPIGCNNDNGTNRYWEKNVKYFLNRANKNG